MLQTILTNSQAIAPQVGGQDDYVLTKVMIANKHFGEVESSHC